MRIAAMLLSGLLAAGCQTVPRDGVVENAIRKEALRLAAESRMAQEADTPRAVADALLPPLSTYAALPPVAPEPRFSLAVKDAPAQQVFMAMVNGTRYSMVLHPEVAGNVSVSLKDVTVLEAMETLRELYGYDYKVQGNRVMVHPLVMQSRVFQVNYLAMERKGRSDTRVASGTISPNSTAPGAAGAAAPAAGAASGNQAQDGIQVSTLHHTDFWSELEATLKAIVGAEGGRSVVASPQSGIVVVRALPRELREVEQFLKASRAAVERQVMLEAKIVEVVLSEGYQAGINWTSFNSWGNHRLSSGANANKILTPGSQFPGLKNGTIAGNASTSSDGTTTASPTALGELVSAVTFGAGRIANSALSGAMGLAFTTNNFAALLNFLETQGTVHVLSSPRIATLNNQKAVLKVGTDEFFVTNITTTTNTSGANTTTSPSIQVQPFFSGISLDVTPQIDDDRNIILHVRPSVSVVAEKSKEIDLGTLGVYRLPLASSNMNQTDSVVRVRDGSIVAIGGLMEQSQTDDAAKVPMAGDVPVLGHLFKQNRKALQKREYVVLLKPTVVESGAAAAVENARLGQRLENLQTRW